MPVLDLWALLNDREMNTGNKLAAVSEVNHLTMMTVHHDRLVSGRWLAAGWALADRWPGAGRSLADRWPGAVPGRRPAIRRQVAGRSPPGPRQHLHTVVTDGTIMLVLPLSCTRFLWSSRHVHSSVAQHVRYSLPVLPPVLLYARCLCQIFHHPPTPIEDVWILVIYNITRLSDKHCTVLLPSCFLAHFPDTMSGFHKSLTVFVHIWDGKYIHYSIVRVVIVQWATSDTGTQCRDIIINLTKSLLTKPKIWGWNWKKNTFIFHNNLESCNGIAWPRRCEALKH